MTTNKWLKHLSEPLWKDQDAYQEGYAKAIEDAAKVCRSGKDTTTAEARLILGIRLAIKALLPKGTK